MTNENKHITTSMKIFIQVAILFIIGAVLVLNYYKSSETEYFMKMDENIQRLAGNSRAELYNNYSILKGLIYDIESTPNSPESALLPVAKAYFSRNPQIAKVSFSDKDGKIISSLKNTGEDITYKYKGKPIGFSQIETSSYDQKSYVNIEMKPSIYSVEEIDTLYPVYKNKTLAGFLSITVNSHNMFLEREFRSLLKKNHIYVSNIDGETIFKSKGFTGKNTYTSKVSIENNHWIIQMESNEDIIGTAIKKSILLALALICVFSFVLYLEWQLLNRGESITELTKLQKEIETIAYSDSLTGLCNRLSITSQISDYIKNAKKEDKCAVVFLDLDDFKSVNDVFGHEKGDDLLKSIAKIFNVISSRNNRIVTSRIGGDEFVALFKDIRSKDEVDHFCKEILSKLSNMPSINNKETNLSASIGVSFFPQGGMDVDTLFKTADIAMYDSKSKGKNRYSFFGDEMGEKMQRKALIESWLRNLINKNDFRCFSLLYQPQIPIASKCEFKMAEALIRCDDKELGFVPTLEFIHAAENTSTIYALGNWVLKETCRYLKRLEVELGEKQNISVNISLKQFREVNFVEKMINTVVSEGVNPSQITIEITEGVFIYNMTECVRILKELKSSGFKISLDNFGTGYSSLSYLRNLPIDILKIDKSFVDNIESDAHSLSLIKGILQLSHSIDLKVVVQGVETYEQYNLLRELGVDVIQGYYFSKPLTDEEYLAFSTSELYTG